MNRRFILLPVAVAAVGLLVAGCSTSSTASSAPTAQPTVSSAPTTQSAASSPTTQPAAATQSTGSAAQGASGHAVTGGSAPKQPLARVFGSVATVNGDTMTVKTQQGSTNVKVTGATIQKTVAGTASDLTAGESVIVVGKQGSDGSLTATNIQIRPANASGQGGFQAPGRGQGQTPRQGQGRPQGQGGQAPQQGQGTRPVVGSVVSLSGNTLTVKGPQGNTTQVKITGSRIEKTVDGTSADLTTGENVTVVGQKASDGTVTATNIQIRPAGTPVRPARAGTPQASPSATPAGN